MESDLLFGTFDTDRTSQEVQEHIRAMSCGKVTFQAKTLGFVYHRLSTKKRRSIQDSPRVEQPESPRKPPPNEPETVVHCVRIQFPTHIYGLSELLQGLYCPACHEHGKNGRGESGRPFTRCGHCNSLRDTMELRCSCCDTPFKK